MVKHYEWKNKEPLDQRFNRKFEIVESGCHEWRGTMSDLGYGLFKVGRKNWKAHKWKYEQLNGTVPEGLELDHLCRNTVCVNPEHLEVVTHGENVRRARLGKRRSHCFKGHPLTPDNIYHTKEGSRACLICIKAKWKRSYDKKRAGLSANRTSG